jgi:integrase
LTTYYELHDHHHVDKPGNVYGVARIDERTGKIERWNIMRRAGLPRIRLHDLRHTAASLMHESGTVQLRTLAAMLGHADPAFTLRTYAHSSDEALTAASSALSGFFDRTSTQSA